MNNHELVFKLNDQEQIVIKVEDPLENIVCCYRVPTIFIGTDYTYELAGGALKDIADILLATMKKALANELVPHKSITKDIGYEWNESYRDKPGFAYEGEIGEVPLWVGDKLRIFASGNSGELCLSVWIYNDKDGSIILEITPDYPFEDEDPQDGSRYIPYEEWIKNYKPLIKRVIPREIAQQWLEQANYIAQTIEKNIKRMNQTNSH